MVRWYGADYVGVPHFNRYCYLSDLEVFMMYLPN